MLIASVLVLLLGGSGVQRSWQLVISMPSAPLQICLFSRKLLKLRMFVVRPKSYNYADLWAGKVIDNLSLQEVKVKRSSFPLVGIVFAATAAALSPSALREIRADCRIHLTLCAGTFAWVSLVCTFCS